MPTAALFRAWSVLNDGMPTMRTDWSALQQVDQACKSHLHNPQDRDLLSQQTEKTVHLPRKCYYGIRQRGEKVWFCVSRCSKRFTGFKLIVNRVIVMMDQYQAGKPTVSAAAIRSAVLVEKKKHASRVSTMDLLSLKGLGFTEVISDSGIAAPTHRVLYFA